MKSEITRVAASFGISLALNFILFASPGDPRETNHSWIDGLMTYMSRPGGLLTEWLLPGHSFQQIVFMIAPSVVFYWIVVWILLTIVRSVKRPTFKSDQF